MSCNCLLIRIDQRDINAATGNTLHDNNTVYITNFNNCYDEPINSPITVKGYYCYCARGVEPILCDMSGYSYNISSEPELLYSPTPFTVGADITPNIYYYVDDVQTSAVYSSYYNSDSECTDDNECCTVCNVGDYCISYTNNPDYNDNYTESGLHNDKPYWVGDVNGLYIYYSIDTTQWCLSSELDGPCLLFGKSPCTSLCPDLLSEFFSEGVCTTTTTIAPPCDTFDFDVLFDCDVTTPTPTPTPTHTPTPTMTPSSNSQCVIAVEVSINSLTPTPTPTMTMTPTPTSFTDRPCQFYGDVTFNTVNDEINCPVSKQFQDCYNGTMYYTTSNVTNPSGGAITEFMVFNATVDGLTKCISYVGITPTVSGVNKIILNSGPYGFSNLNGCSSCIPMPTPTPTITPTITMTMTPSSTPPVNPILCDMSGYTYDIN